MASKTHIKDLILGQDQMDFPNNDGTANQVLTTDGAQNITWQNPWANMNLEDLQDVTSGIAGKSLLYLNHATMVWEGMTVNSLTTTVQEATSIEELNNVSTGATSGQVLQYDGSEWVPTTPSTGSTTFAGLSDVTFTTLAAGDWLYYGGSSWTNLSSVTAGLVMAGSFGLSNIADVNAPTPSDGEVLTWDNSTSRWIAEAPVDELNDLSDVVIGVDAGVSGSTALTAGDFMWYNGTTWRNYPAETAGEFLENYIELDTLSNVDTTAGKSVGDVLQWDGLKWEATAGSGIQAGEFLHFENFCYNSVTTGTDTYYWLPGSTAQGMHVATGSSQSSMTTAAMWNGYKKLSHRVPAGTWDIDVYIDLSMTTDTAGKNHASQYAEEGTSYYIYKVGRNGGNGNVTITTLTSGTIFQDATDTAVGTEATASVTGEAFDGEERILVVLKGILGLTSTHYAHWAYDVQATKQ